MVLFDPQKRTRGLDDVIHIIAGSTPDSSSNPPQYRAQRVGEWPPSLNSGCALESPAGVVVQRRTPAL